MTVIITPEKKIWTRKQEIIADATDAASRVEIPKKIIYKPSPKSVSVFRDAHLAKYRFLMGAVRSAKSYTANDLAIHEIQKLPACNVLISGYSITTVARNIIAEWKAVIDPFDLGLFHHVKDAKDDYIWIDWRGLRNKKFYIRGAGKDNDWKAIQGSTFGYWLADEITRHCENFVDMAMTRLSPPYAKAIWTTNPDGPQHFIKKRFIDDDKLYFKRKDGTSLFKSWTFYLDDNPSLTRDYIDSLKLTYSGVFYKRYILSMWVMAEGTIYDFFDEAIHTKHSHELPKTNRHILGIDYGTSNPTVFILMGINENPYADMKVWAEKEYYYDPEKWGRQKTDKEFSRDLGEFTRGTDIEEIFIDPSAASLKVQLSRDGFGTLMTDADNDVISGIRTQARMLKSGEYVVSKRCTKTILDYSGYAWDAKAQEVGEDKPLKTGNVDHTKDAERYPLHSRYGQHGVDLEQLVKQ